ncbi:MAG: hypothetical protein ACOX5R_08485 [bacterium]|jgi:hypothetical protein
MRKWFYQILTGFLLFGLMNCGTAEKVNPRAASAESVGKTDAAAANQSGAKKADFQALRGYLIPE